MQKCYNVGIMNHVENSKTKERRRFSIVARMKSATHAWRGVGIIVRSTHNMWVHIFFALFAIWLGFILKISNMEWIAVLFAIAFVIVAEAFNTAIEIDIDLTSPEYHPYARDTKDVAAGAVLLSGVFAFIVGAIVFLPKLFVL